MMEKFIFLDVDGVLNDHTKHPNGYCGIRPECMYHLNRIVAETEARLVISSAWRYMLNSAMSVDGFRYMLMTYGLDESVHISGKTAIDELCPHRGEQISLWVADYTKFTGDYPPYVVIDDGSDEPPRHPETMTLSESLALCQAGQWVKTTSNIGLTDADADRAIAILNGGR
jgi:hypothetical protein